jgi:hypothetical protein
MEVSTLSRKVMLPRLNLYPLGYRAAFACSILPYPQSLGLALRFAFPSERTRWENYGLTTFRVSARVG